MKLVSAKKKIDYLSIFNFSNYYYNNLHSDIWEMMISNFFIDNEVSFVEDIILSFCVIGYIKQ